MPGYFWPNIDLNNAQQEALQAARDGDLDRLKSLLAGSDVFKDSDKLTAAFQEHRVKDADYNDRIIFERLCDKAARGAQPETLRYLLEQYHFPGDQLDGYSIYAAIETGSIETVQVLLNYHPNITKLEFFKDIETNLLDFALRLEGRQAAIQMTELLLKNGMDPNIKSPDGMPIEAAITSSWPELRQLLESYGAKPYPHDDELRLLPRAAHKSCLEAVIRLVEKGADVNEPSSKGFTPLFNAVMNGDAPVVDYLLRAGADPNKRSGNSAQTPLEMAEERSDYWAAVRDILRKYGAGA